MLALKYFYSKAHNRLVPRNSNFISQIMRTHRWPYGPRYLKSKSRYLNLSPSFAVKTYVYNITDVHGKDGGEYNCDFGRPWDAMLLTPISTDLQCPDSLEVVKAGEAMKAKCTLKKNGPENIEIKWKMQGDVLLN